VSGIPGFLHGALPRAIQPSILTNDQVSREKLPEPHLCQAPPLPRKGGQGPSASIPLPGPPALPPAWGRSPSPLNDHYPQGNARCRASPRHKAAPESSLAAKLQGYPHGQLYLLARGGWSPGYLFFQVWKGSWENRPPPRCRRQENPLRERRSMGGILVFQLEKGPSLKIAPPRTRPDGTKSLEVPSRDILEILPYAATHQRLYGAADQVGPRGGTRVESVASRSERRSQTHQRLGRRVCERRVEPKAARIQ
jgi:hypothetical protein